MIALSGPKLKLENAVRDLSAYAVSMIALSGPKLKLEALAQEQRYHPVSMIALSGPKLKRQHQRFRSHNLLGFNDSTEWA